VNVPIDILLGLKQSADLIDATQITGSFVRWYEIVALSGIVFAVAEFMERTKIRAYIFKTGSLAKDAFELILLSIVAVIAANFIPLVHAGSYAVPLLSYPAFWELLSLSFFTLAIALLLIFALFPFRFINKINHKNCEKFYWEVYGRLLNDSSIESLAAISIIVERNLKNLFMYAAMYDSWWDVQGSKYSSPYEMYKVPKKYEKLVDCSRSFIDKMLSTKEFCNYLAKNNIGLVLKIIEATNRYHLYRSCGRVFFNSFCKEMFFNDDSHLSKEMEYRGQGLDKPVYNNLFRSLSIVDGCYLFDSCAIWNIKNASPEVVGKYIEALKISMEEFVARHGHGCIFQAGPGGHALYSALKHLPHVLSSIFLKLKKVDEEEIYFNEYSDIISVIESFFGMDLEEIISKADSNGVKDYCRDKKIDEYSLADGVCKVLFEFLDSLLILKQDSYARHLSTSIFWAIFPVVQDRPLIIQKIEDRLLEMITKRIEENKKGHYPPLIKLMINIYGYEFHSGTPEKVRIGRYIEQEFKEFFAERILINEENEKRYLPSDCSVERDKGVIRDCNGEIMYQRETVDTETIFSDKEAQRFD
jgi:hypothetical protein